MLVQALEINLDPKWYVSCTHLQSHVLGTVSRAFL